MSYTVSATDSSSTFNLRAVLSAGRKYHAHRWILRPADQACHASLSLATMGLFGPSRKAASVDWSTVKATYGGSHAADIRRHAKPDVTSLSSITPSRRSGHSYDWTKGFQLFSRTWKSGQPRSDRVVRACEAEERKSDSRSRRGPTLLKAVFKATATVAHTYH